MVLLEALRSNFQSKECSFAFNKISVIINLQLIHRGRFKALLLTKLWLYVCQLRLDNLQELSISYLNFRFQCELQRFV